MTSFDMELLEGNVIDDGAVMPYRVLKPIYWRFIGNLWHMPCHKAFTLRQKAVYVYTNYTLMRDFAQQSFSL